MACPRCGSSAGHEGGGWRMACRRMPGTWPPRLSRRRFRRVSPAASPWRTGRPARVFSADRARNPQAIPLKFAAVLSHPFCRICAVRRQACRPPMGMPPAPDGTRHPMAGRLMQERYAFRFNRPSRRERGQSVGLGDHAIRDAGDGVGRACLKPVGKGIAQAQATRAAKAPSRAVAAKRCSMRK